MKKVLVYVLIAVLFLASCSAEELPTTESTAEIEATVASTEPTENTPNEQHKHNHLTETVMSEMSGDTVDLPGAGLYGLTVKQKEYGRLDESGTSVVYLLQEHPDSSIYHWPYIAVKMEDKTLVKDVTYHYEKSSDDGEYGILASLGTAITLCDVDGDDSGYNEIIVHQCIAMSGGWGGWNSTVYRLEGDEIVEIFNTDVFGDGLFDTGFTYKINEDYSVLVKNSYTGEEYLLDSEKEKEFVESVRPGEAPTEEEELWCDSMYSFKPVWSSEKGIYQLRGRQYTCIDSHVDFIGVAEVILEYDKEQDTFVIVDTDFIGMSQEANIELDFVN